MAAERDADVDPRFDPVFQRGYDPQVHGERRSRTAPRKELSGVPVDSLSQRSTPEQTETPPRGWPTAENATERPERRATRDDPAQVEPVAAHRNPFRLALLISSVVAIAGAALIMWRQIDDPYRYGATGTDVAAQFMQQFTDSLLVPLLTGGLIGLTLWLSIGALHHRDAAGRTADETTER